MDLFLMLQLPLERLALIRLEPLRLPRAVGEEEQDDHAQQHRRNAPEDVNPLPAFQAEQLGVPVGADPEQLVGDLGTDDLGDRRGQEEARQGPGPVAAGEPVRQVNDHPGEEPGLGEAQQEPDRIEMPGDPSRTPSGRP